MKKLILILLIIGMVLPMVSAIDDRYKLNEQADIKFSCENGVICDSSYKCNLTILYPNKSIFLEDAKATYNLNYFNVSTDNLSERGIWTGLPTCCIGSTCKQSPFYFEVTDNGYENPSGIVISLFSILFIGIISLLCYTIFRSLEHFITFNMNIYDLSFILSSYFVLFSTYILSIRYLGNLIVQNFLLLLVKITAITHVLLPVVCFALSLIIAKLRIKEKNPFGSEETSGEMNG